ncbi:MAG: papain-like cysteine protease family protein [Candidatus Omnitrophota bacterium]|nr:papain-like cysteine protease family protein [Candidatus Omnitrophota bacterium]
MKKNLIVLFLTLAVILVSKIALTIDIPYIEQESAKKHNKGLCGAACLSMVYASYGKNVDQWDIFYNIAVPGGRKGDDGRPGSGCSHYLMVRDALNRGFYAICIAMKNPQEFFDLYRSNEIDHSIRIILSHRPKKKTMSLHATVLLDVTDTEVIIHDPDQGPSRHVAMADFIEMWQGMPPTKNRLVAISDKKYGKDKCSVCKRPVPDHLECPDCHRKIGLEPKELIGCIYYDCPGRFWESVQCPYCGRVTKNRDK